MKRRSRPVRLPARVAAIVERALSSNLANATSMSRRRGGPRVTTERPGSRRDRPRPRGLDTVKQRLLHRRRDPVQWRAARPSDLAYRHTRNPYIYVCVYIHIVYMYTGLGGGWLLKTDLRIVKFRALTAYVGGGGAGVRSRSPRGGRGG